MTPMIGLGVYVVSLASMYILVKYAIKTQDKPGIYQLLSQYIADRHWDYLVIGFVPVINTLVLAWTLASYFEEYDKYTEERIKEKRRQRSPNELRWDKDLEYLKNLYTELMSSQTLEDYVRARDLFGFNLRNMIKEAPSSYKEALVNHMKKMGDQSVHQKFSNNSAG